MRMNKMIGIVCICQRIAMMSIDIDLKIGHDRYIDRHLLCWRWQCCWISRIIMRIVCCR
jgi:hypothetical protein